MVSRHRYPGWKSGLREGCQLISHLPSHTGFFYHFLPFFQIFFCPVIQVAVMMMMISHLPSHAGDGGDVSVGDGDGDDYVNNIDAF